jgi:outer membrane cobalamin receptor
MGSFRLSNLPFNNYHIEVTQAGFAVASQDVNVRSVVPSSVKIALALAGVQSSVTVELAGADLLETVPVAHTDVDISTLDKLPTLSPASGLSDAIILSSPGVVADSNGFFHPLGDHAQTSFSIDGQPVSDQQSKAFSTQLPVNAIQSMEIISGTPDAEYGDKTSLVVSATTRSGLGVTKPAFSLQTQYGSFGTATAEITAAFGSKKVGYFVAANGTTSGRFLDTPEFDPHHDKGNSQNMFNRFDYNPTGKDSIHLNFFIAENYFQIPNSNDQPDQDQRQKVRTISLAPGYQHTFGSNSLLTVNPFYRQDHVNFYPSADPFDDSPATLSQFRTLSNYGTKADFSYSNVRHNVKIGTQLMRTHLNENFSLGITDPLFNAVCVNAAGDPLELPAVTDPNNCPAAGTGITANPDLQPGLIPLDLTRGGSLFQYAATGNVDVYSGYIQDLISYHNFTFNGGLRLDHYSGITKDTAWEPRLGISYIIHSSGTVLRAGYARTMETPYNENLLLSSATGNEGLTDIFGAQGDNPLKPGRRNQYNVGFQQAFSRYLQVDGEYFWKFTDNAYDFDVILNTPITFPISWQKSKLDGASFRISTANLHGIQLSTTIGHTRARFFGPETGGLLFNSPVDLSVFRIDHDQAFQQTTTMRYQPHKNGLYETVTWRYDSGLVGGVGSPDELLGMTAAEQAAVGAFCGSTFATVSSPITSCSDPNFGAKRLRIPAAGTEDDDHNPPRIAPRHVFDANIGTDNLFRGEGMRVTARFTVMNFTNRDALYNFQSTFSGTHFLGPRSYTGTLGFVF